MIMKDATPQTPLAHEQNSIFKCKQHKSMIPENKKNMNAYLKAFSVQYLFIRNILCYDYWKHFCDY